jgi:hypothetical protein
MLVREYRTPEPKQNRLRARGLESDSHVVHVRAVEPFLAPDVQTRPPNLHV